MTRLPNWVYDDAVRVLLKCPDIPSHAHISIEALRAMADDAFGPGVFRKAVELAYDEGRAVGRDSGYHEGHEAGRESAQWAAEHPDD